MKDRQFVRSRMDALWNPRNVAMIGATNKLEKWGAIILSRILHQGFAGEVWPVNPRDGRVLGKKAYPSIADVPGKADLAVIVTPAPTVPGVMKQCADAGVPAAVVITSGFSETGDDGARAERELTRIARDSGMIYVGPNTMGIFSAPVNFNCMMAPVYPLKGSAACIAQSGNVGTHMLFRGRLRGLGFGKFVSSGNEGDLSFEDYLWYFGQDSDTSAVLGYLEGLDPGSDFVEVASEVTKKKPVILLKGGRTSAGAAAASSHTGAMAGDLGVVKGALSQAGVIMAESNREVVELGRALELQPVPKGGRIGILTRGGGWGVITSDACVEAGLELSRLTEATLQKLDKMLPPYWSRGNPVDMVAVISFKKYIDCLDILVRDPNVDAVIALGANTDAQSKSMTSALRELGVLEEKEVERIENENNEELGRFIDALRGYISQSDKPILTVGRWRETPDWEAGLMMIGEPEDAARMMQKMVRYGMYLGSELRL